MGVSNEAMSDAEESYLYRIVADQGIRIVRLRDLFSAVIEELGEGVSRERISVKFHNTVAQIINEMCQLIANETAITRVALSGGVFQNRLLLRKTVSLLERSGFQVFTHKQVPCNDGGISLGQAVIANFAA
jgi:hydrogenase maturation protein HypF